MPAMRETLQARACFVPGAPGETCLRMTVRHVIQAKQLFQEK